MRRPADREKARVDRIPESGNAGEKLTDRTADASQSKPAGSGGLAFLPVVITTIFKWIWLLIKGVNDPQMNKPEMLRDMISNDVDQQAKAETESGEQTHLRTVENTKKISQGP